MLDSVVSFQWLPLATVVRWQLSKDAGLSISTAETIVHVLIAMTFSSIDKQVIVLIAMTFRSIEK